MNLSQALRLRSSEVVSLVGGGGKTSAMFRLAAEIVAAGGRVITTTTTRLGPEQTELAPAHRVVADTLPNDLAQALEENKHVLLTGPRDGRKMLGISDALISQMQALAGHPILVVEADGARMRPFKAPADHEPAIPPQTTLVVPVVGADALGLPLTEEVVHRLPQVLALAGAAPGQAITPEVVARVLAHADGGLKNVPPGARAVALINKAESAQQLAGGREIARKVLSSGRYESVVLGHVRGETPVVEAWGRVAGIILAAGQSRRMGQLKQVMPWGAGGTVVGEVIRRMQRVEGLAEIVVVTGCERERVEAAVARARLPEGTPVRTTFNPKFASAEMARSLQAGLNALSGDYQAVLVALGDQPLLSGTVAASLVQRWRETRAPALAPFFQGQRGNPVVLDRDVWPLVRALPDEANPRQIFQAGGWLERVEVDDETILYDLDTPEDYARQAPGAPGV